MNGNRVKSNGLNIIQINKGNCNFEKSIDSIQSIINDEKPDIICISETNIIRSNSDICNYFPNYNHELNLVSETINISRNSILINSRLNYKRRKDLESPQTCNIWIEIGINKGKSE